MLVENEEQMVTGIPEVFSGRLSVGYEVGFGHVCSAVRTTHGSRASVIAWCMQVEIPAYTLSCCLRVLCAVVSMRDA